MIYEIILVLIYKYHIDIYKLKENKKNLLNTISISDYNLTNKSILLNNHLFLKTSEGELIYFDIFLPILEKINIELDQVEFYGYMRDLFCYNQNSIKILSKSNSKFEIVNTVPFTLKIDNLFIIHDTIIKIRDNLLFLNKIS